MEEITAVNKKISDAAHSLSTGGLSSGNNNDGGMPWMTKAGNSGPRQDARHDYSLPVDVDTAAARLKRRYQFISSQELESLRNRNNHGDWSAAAIDEAHSVWEAMPGSYYKMGHDWN